MSIQNHLLAYSASALYLKEINQNSVLKFETFHVNYVAFTYESNNRKVDREGELGKEWREKRQCKIPQFHINGKNGNL